MEYTKAELEVIATALRIAIKAMPHPFDRCLVLEVIAKTELMIEIAENE